MTLVDDIEAIRARADLTGPEKRQAIYDLKSARIIAALAGRVGVPIVRGVFVFTLTEEPVWADNKLRLMFTLTKNGTPVPFNLPLYIVNPPILVPDGAGGFTINLLQAIRDVIMDMVP